MGGPGSGDWLRWNSKTTTESQHRIDIRWLRKQRYLQPGISGTLSWSCRGLASGSIDFRVETERLILNYRNRQNGGEWENIADEIIVTWTPCNYGGNRRWFLCPGCNRRVAVIYGGKYYRAVIATASPIPASRKAGLTLSCERPGRSGLGWEQATTS